LPIILVFSFAVTAAAVEPETAELSFDSSFNRPDVLKQANAPVWITKVEQYGGAFLDSPRCWQTTGTAPKGIGRLSIGLDRTKMNEDLVATILLESGQSADVVVQLFDAYGRVVEVDLFGNLVEVGNEAKTDTYVIPLQKYPTAEKIVIRRIEGDLKVYGMVLYPTVTSGQPNVEALKKLAAVLGDPLSPENPLSKSLRDIANDRKLELERKEGKTSKTAQDTETPRPTARVKYGAAAIPRASANLPPAPVQGLVGYWNFDQGDANDVSGKGHHGKIRGGATIVDEGNGKALRTRKNPSSARAASWDSVTMPTGPDLALTDTITVSAWVKYSSIPGTWGSQIAWFGNSEYGRDPWTLQLYPDGTLSFRSDRSVTGRPIFTVFDDELYLSSSGKPMMNQHVSVESPGTLQSGSWYFVAGTIEKLSPRARVMRLYVNGEPVSEVKTKETVNYPTDKMWMAIGAVDLGTWQNFDGLIDEVRVYDRPLSPEEIKALYVQPWK
jgi:hypothetical protein